MFGCLIFRNDLNTKFNLFTGIILGAVIGTSICTILVLIILLYSCDRYRKKRRATKVLRQRGEPHEEHGWYEDELEAEARLNDFTPYKPEEVLTIDRRSMLDGKLFAEDEHSLYSHNICSTLGRRGNVNLGYSESIKRSLSIREHNNYTPPTTPVWSDMEIPQIVVSPPPLYSELGERVRHSYFYRY